MTVVDLTPIDRYLAEQADLTAVTRFSQFHDDPDERKHADRHYRELIPLERPAPGEQYRFDVDLDACTGCKACVTACHNLNGLDDGEAWRSVGLLHGSNGTPYRQTVTTACHHCLDPACLNGCPANAYTKDATTGIVKHLDDQCIGCGYCTFMCPYDVPQYNDRLGIVRKCDMCQDRLATGEAPACVQGCPNDAISIGVVSVDELRASASTETLVTDAPPSHITIPTTRYRSRRSQDGLIAADHFALRPAVAHPPLAIMLVLTQLSVGAFLAEFVLRSVAPAGDVSGLRSFNAPVALALGLLALGASVLHLGRPLYAFRAALGVAHSWLSREIIAFGAFSALASAYAVTSLTSWPSGGANVLRPFVALSGTLGVGCSVMVYAVTRRTWWRPLTTGTKFVGTSAVCGSATVLVTASVGAPGVVRPIALTLMAATAIKLASEAVLFRHLREGRDTERKRTAMLLTGDLGRATWWRFIAGIAGGLVAPAIVLASTGGSSPVAVAFVSIAGALTVTAGELIERAQFFRAVVSPRMPGGV
ncbi:MAG: DmsC/YnfH family molybdoenzyme membrane anchor subunit [Actinomycetota bacterium]